MIGVNYLLECAVARFTKSLGESGEWVFGSIASLGRISGEVV